MDDPAAEITYDFYDDRDDIFYHLNQFLTIHPELIPNNVCIRLNHYTGNRVSKVCHELQGTGFIDRHYRQTVKDMINHQEREQYEEGSLYQEPLFLTSSLSLNALIHRIPLDQAKSSSKMDLEVAIVNHQKGIARMSDAMNPFFAKSNVPTFMDSSAIYKEVDSSKKGADSYSKISNLHPGS